MRESIPTSMPRALAIVGPTASGKTSLAIRVAHEVEGEIISMDSRQAYRGFSVGTAAPTLAERESAVHHGVGFLDPNERYGTGRFVRFAETWLLDIEAKGHTPIFTGGAGLFLRALVQPIFKEPKIDPDRRAALEAWLAGCSALELERWARRLDGAQGAKSPLFDRQRAGRTIELALLSGAPLSWWIEKGGTDQVPLGVRTYQLVFSTDVLRARIRNRTVAMVSSGAWQEEVRGIIKNGLHRSPAFDALGYSVIAAHVKGEMTEEKAVDRIFSDTWAYARRQRTWFRHQLPEDAIVLDGSESTEQLTRRISQDWNGLRAAP
jgi:tRNA dimethylallyltransferase